MANEPELPEQKYVDVLIANALNVILNFYKPATEITDDSMTTPELCEIIQDHVGLVLATQVVKAMIDAGYSYKFSFARKELVWCMEMA